LSVFKPYHRGTKAVISFENTQIRRYALEPTGTFTTDLVTAELFVASNLSVFLQRNTMKVRRN
jgi:hypothetical protein